MGVSEKSSQLSDWTPASRSKSELTSDFIPRNSSPTSVYDSVGSRSPCEIMMEFGSPEILTCAEEAGPPRAKAHSATDLLATNDGSSGETTRKSRAVEGGRLAGLSGGGDHRPLASHNSPAIKIGPAIASSAIAAIHGQLFFPGTSALRAQAEAVIRFGGGGAAEAGSVRRGAAAMAGARGFDFVCT